MDFGLALNLFKFEILRSNLWFWIIIPNIIFLFLWTNSISIKTISQIWIFHCNCFHSGTELKCLEFIRNYVRIQFSSKMLSSQLQIQNWIEIVNFLFSWNDLLTLAFIISFSSPSLLVYNHILCSMIICSSFNLFFLCWIFILMLLYFFLLIFF